MKTYLHLLNRNIVADEALIRVVQIACFFTSVVLLGLSIWKLTRLELTEAQMFFGVLLSVVTPLLFIVIGLMLPMAITRKSA